MEGLPGTIQWGVFLEENQAFQGRAAKYIQMQQEGEALGSTLEAFGALQLGLKGGWSRVSQDTLAFWRFSP